MNNQIKPSWKDCFQFTLDIAFNKINTKYGTTNFAVKDLWYYNPWNP